MKRIIAGIFVALILVTGCLACFAESQDIDITNMTAVDLGKYLDGTWVTNHNETICYQFNGGTASKYNGVHVRIARSGSGEFLMITFSAGTVQIHPVKTIFIGDQNTFFVTWYEDGKPSNYLRSVYYERVTE